ncbi:LCP family protein [Candidatus Soleaferrea massiliensis]|uniref:LCP family protein n=1 Tax=Candidatus Soleaferrea massiliensis TaxID=1470354 RepID=UPI00058EE191|nr:LCP family protein [Candidatus Soleaferrea massiliensis]
MANQKINKKPLSRRSKVLRIVSAVVIFICLIFIIIVAALNYRPSQEQGGEPPITSSIQTPAEHQEKVVNFLCIGVDNSENLTDVIIYLSYDRQEKKASMLRIPRDTFVGDDIPTGKINAVYGHAPEGKTKIGYLIERVNEMFDLPVDHYATITLEGFRSIVDSIGGVEVDVPQTIYYDEYQGMVIPAGLQQLDGEKAEWFVRYRAGYANADLGRIDAQNLFIEAFLKKVKDLGRMKLVSLLSGLSDEMGFTTDMSVGEMIGYAGDLFGIDVDEMESVTLPGAGDMHEGVAVYELFPEETAEILNKSFRPYSDPVPADELNIAQIPGNYYSDNGYGE